MDWTPVIDGLLEREGGFTNHPADRGGATKYGITQAALAAWRGHPVTIDDVRALDLPEARAIYLQRYIVGPGFDAPQIKPGLADQLVDYGVNSGPGVAISKLQALLGVAVDGVLGPQTLAALAAADQLKVNNSLAVARILMIGRLVAKAPSQVPFLVGWLARACEFFHFESR